MAHEASPSAVVAAVPPSKTRATLLSIACVRAIHRNTQQRYRYDNIRCYTHSKKNSPTPSQRPDCCVLPPRSRGCGGTMLLALLSCGLHVCRGRGAGVRHRSQRSGGDLFVRYYRSSGGSIAAAVRMGAAGCSTRPAGGHTAAHMCDRHHPRQLRVLSGAAAAASTSCHTRSTEVQPPAEKVQEASFGLVRRRTRAKRTTRSEPAGDLIDESSHHGRCGADYACCS